MTPFLTPTASSECDHIEQFGNEQDNHKENSEDDNCSNAGQLGITKDNLALDVTGKKEKSTVGFKPTTTGLKEQRSIYVFTCDFMANCKFS